MLIEFEEKEKKALLLLIFACILAYLVGWTIPLMEIDAAQYANISREMLLHKHFLELYDRGKDYLDKPPMLFWLSALSMYVFGLHDWAYRLPSFLFAILSIYSTYRLALLYYSERVALVCALVLASCQAMFLITHDVRTDTMLMGWVVLGIWQLASWYKSGRWVHLLMASLAIAGGMMTKGPIALMVPVFAFVPHLLLQRAWKQLLRWEYLVMALVIGVLLIPMSVGLYRQYDLHPEKVMYGQRGTSGLRFFYWTQSFGRITGESTWHENDSFFFLFENMLWGFLPWIVFFIWGLLRGVSNLVRDRFRITPAQEWISMGGFLVTYCALGVSRFQLPHYIYVVFPLVAIIAGRAVHDLCYSEVSRKWEMRMFKFHACLFGLMALAVFVLLIVPFPPVSKVLIAAALGSLLFLILILVKGSLPLPRLLVLGVSAILFINVFVDLGFYRPLLEYQMSVPVSRWIQAQHLDMDHFFVYQTDEERSMHFYSNHFFVHITNPDSLNHLDYVLTSQQGMDSLNKDLFRVIYQGENFHVTGLSLSFLNPATRRKETTAYYVLQRK